MRLHGRNDSEGARCRLLHMPPCKDSDTCTHRAQGCNGSAGQLQRMSTSNDQPTAAGVDGRRLQANDVNFFAGQAMTLRFHISAACRFARACDARSLYAAGVCLKHFGPPHWAVNAKKRTTQQHRTSRSANAYVCMWSACDERERRPCEHYH